MDSLTPLKRRTQRCCKRRQAHSVGTRFRNPKMHILLISLALLLGANMVAGQDLSDYFSTPITPVNQSPVEDSPLPLPSNATATPGNVTVAPGNGTATSPPPEATVAATTLSPTTAIPAETETDAPTLITASPTLITLAPTVKETTLSPTTASPTFMPTDLSVSTLAPTDEPTLAPDTMSPTMLVTTVAPAPAPTNATSTMSPTSAVITTLAPTEGGTEAPTFGEAVVTTSPTTLDVTESPTTSSPTETPGTESPTTNPGGVVIEEVITNLKIDFVGMNQVLGVDAENEWKRVTEEHTKDYYRQNPNLQITDVTTTVSLEIQKLGSQRRRGLLRSNSRNLQTTVVTVTYNQEISYRTQDPDRDPPQAVVLAPFQTPLDLENYLATLKDASTEFESVVSVNPATRDSTGDPRPTRPPEPEDEGGLGTGALIGIIAGSVVGVIVLLAVAYFVSQRGDDGGYVSTGKTPPAQLDVNHGDEVSTLAEPHTNSRTGVTNALSGESGAGYGDQSVATVDYDYSKAYGGGGDTSVSSAGGTFGSQTHTQGAGGATMASATGANGNPLDSFPENGSGFRGANANVREELIDIYAPPGKLGVVIDTPDDGAPVVHAVKDSSVIADKLQVGDKLVAVDDEDVRSMTAIKVSKLISRKSANPSRKLSIIRTVVVDE